MLNTISDKLLSCDWNIKDAAVQESKSDVRTTAEKSAPIHIGGAQLRQYVNKSTHNKYY